MRSFTAGAFMGAYPAWLCLALSVLCTSPMDDASAAIDISRMVRDAAEAELRRSGVPSLQIAVTRDGRVIFQEAYGWADVEQKVAATVHSKYRTASVSKWMTTSAALLLVDREIRFGCNARPHDARFRSARSPAK
jgi:CubicO group peptidase (beta-lactamase class C family)